MRLHKENGVSEKMTMASLFLHKHTIQTLSYTNTHTRLRTLTVKTSKQQILLLGIKDMAINTHEQVFHVCRAHTHRRQVAEVISNMPAHNTKGVFGLQKEKSRDGESFSRHERNR